MRSKSYLFVIAGASLWGIIGIFVNALYNMGLTPLEIVTARVLSAALILIMYIAVKSCSLLKIKLKDSVYFIGTGICSIAFFSWCYFTAIRETTLAVAVILLYTGPIFVAILSRIFFQEYFTFKKIVALMLTFLGCVLVTGFFAGGKEQISLYGLLVGLGAGFGYALYSIFGKVALKKYHSLTVTAYTFIFASLALIPAVGLEAFVSKASPQLFLYIAGLGFLPTVLAYILYTQGLSEIESSKAAITATIEPVVATLISVFVFQEEISIERLAGIFLVLLAVIMVQDKKM